MMCRAEAGERKPLGRVRLAKGCFLEGFLELAVLNRFLLQRARSAKRLCEAPRKAVGEQAGCFEVHVQALVLLLQ